VRTRTYLTTPPGAEPTDHTGRREPDGERYVPALDLPTEPRVAGKHRRLLVILAVVAALGLLVFVLLRIGAAAQAEDPALSEPSAAAAAVVDRPLGDR
jgi:hypothetical protein